MNNTLAHKTIHQTLDYFRPPEFYFWQWAEEGKVLEWIEGSTICYREDVLPVLRVLGTEGIPPFGSILLAMTACQDHYKDGADCISILQQVELFLQQNENQSPLLTNLPRLLEGVIGFLQTIHALPRELRTGHSRKHLMHVVFEATTFRIRPQDAQLILQELDSGRLDEEVFQHRDEPITCQYFIADLKNLYEASRIFAEPGSLERKVRTGIRELPAPAELEIPDTQDSLSLLEQLETDPITQPISRLTRRLMATLTIPMHTHHSGDQPLGGVSDISNRGSLDKLLLSELAQDDMALLARLANNEALYIRREEVPNPQHRKRVLLLDTTLKMWGLPRIFALSAALACTQQKKTDATCTAYALAGTEAYPIDLSTKEGVIATFGQLYPELHCGAALATFLKAQPLDPHTEYFFLTDAHTLHTPEFQSFFSGLKPLLHLLITVSRDGQLHAYECHKNSQRLLHKLHLDLDEILFAPVIQPLDAHAEGSLPAFLQQTAMPLYVPSPNNKLIASSLYGDKVHGYVCVTQTQMVLYWPYKTLGAIELWNYIEEGNYSLGHDPVSTHIYVLVYVSARKLCKLYQFSMATGEKSVFDYAELADSIQTISFYAGIFYVTTHAGLYTFNPADRTYTRQTTGHQPRQMMSTISFKEVKKHINSGYTTLTKAHRMYITTQGRLAIDTRELVLMHDCMLLFQEGTHTPHPSTTATKTEGITFAEIVNPHHRFMKFTWPDGSEALIDSRGFLHLRSSDKTLPEITLLYITNATTAGWTSKGDGCGNSYFIQEKNNVISPLTFYNTYIQPFIDKLSEPGLNGLPG